MEVDVAELEVVEGKYLQDLLDQPRSLEDTLAAMTPSKALSDLCVRLRRGKFDRVVLTGMGSSFHALHPLNLQLLREGFTSVMAETSELIHYQTHFFDPKTLIVAVSQSGQSAEIVRLFEVNRKRAAVIGVTNTADSALAKRATAAVSTHAGAEFSVSCKTYVASLLALQWVADILCQRSSKKTLRELKTAAPAVAAYIKDWKKHVTGLMGVLKGMRHLFIVGRGRSLAAVGTGALIVKESDHFHAEGISSAAFRHGPFEMLSNETFVVVFSGDKETRDLNRRLVADVQQAGAHAELVGEDSSLDSFRLADHHSSVRPILEILPIQMLTLALGALAGREPGKFHLATKVTTAE
jgi:glutamine---fructose-6-phosphate transaminase (isomerizing)